MSEEAGPLSELRVLECGDAVSSAYCAKLLAGLGAEVVKVERPRIGDSTRGVGPFPNDTPDINASSLFVFLNADKSDITLDILHPLGMRVFQRLCADIDALITGLPPIEAERLDYQKACRTNPRLIVTLLTPFGLTSPLRDWKASELTLMHTSGVAYYTPGNVVDPNKEPPLKPGGRQAEFMAGMAGALATMAAIAHREWTGQGQVVDLAERDVSLLANMWNLATISYTGLQPSRKSEGRATIAPLHMLPCKDGWVQIGCAEEEQWRGLLEALGNPQWAQIELFKTRFSRGEHWDGLEPLLSEETMKWEKEDLSRAAQAKGAPCTAVASPGDMLRGVHLRERGFFQGAAIPGSTRAEMPARPFIMHRTPFKPNGSAPRLGQHNEEIYCKRLGLSMTEVEEMRSAGIL